MISFNKFNLRKDEAGTTFLDLEINLELAPQKTVMRLSIPAAVGYQATIAEGALQDLDSNRSENPNE